MRDQEFFSEANMQLAAHKDAVLVVVAEHAKGSPGKAGFKMLVLSTGATIGTVGGGIMELDLIEDAKGMLASGEVEAKLVYKVHSKKADLSVQSGMICAGSQRLILCLLNWQRDRAALQQLVGGSDAVIPSFVKAMPDGPLDLGMTAQVGPHVIPSFVKGMPDGPADLGMTARVGPHVIPSAERVGDPIEPTRTLRIKPCGLVLAKAPAKGNIVFTEQGDDFCYEENIAKQPNLFIIGGGHVGVALARAVAPLDFSVHIFDHRENLHTLADVPSRQTIHIADYAHLATLVPKASFCAVVSTSYYTDLAALTHLLPLPLRYLGVMGSPAKIYQLKKELLSRGFKQDDFTRLTAPIGLAIDSHTPAEIAISIAAQLIAIKNAK